MTVPLFDSLAHPTLSGDWFKQRGEASFAQLEASMKTGGFSRACAIGMHGLEGYQHKAFIDECKKNMKLVPIAGYSPVGSSDISTDLAKLKSLGYLGIKVHPRFSSLSLDDPKLIETFNAASTHDLVVFLCTYQFCNISEFPDEDPFTMTVRLLKQTLDTKVVLVHGGAVELMRYAELARFDWNLLLDLSLTITKYEGSSVDSDIKFLFNQFDRRICIGSDFPEYDHSALRRRFELFSDGLSTEKAENVGFGNLERFLGL